MDDRFFKNLPLTKFDFRKFENPQIVSNKIRETFFVFVLKCIQTEHDNNLNRIWGKVP